MTICALAAELALVWIVIRMTTDTGVGCSAEAVVRRVAGFAARQAVRPLQRKVGEVVVKRRPVEFQSFRTPAFVLGVAELAFVAGDIRVKAVQPRTSTQIRADLGMADDAQLHLRLISRR